MEIQEQKHGAVAVIKPAGPLVGADAKVFADQVRQSVDRSRGRVVVDASAIPYMDSGGLETLVELAESLMDAGFPLKLCGAGETLRQTVEVTGWEEVFEFHEDVQQGVRSFL